MKQMRRDRAAQPSNPDPESFQSGSQPESLLWPALLGAAALPLSFFWFGWSAEVKIHWACPVIALGLYSWGNNLLYVSSMFHFLQKLQY